jgi:hypothetical protein
MTMILGESVNERRTRANSAPLNARVTLDLANRLRQHLVDRGCGNLSDFVSAAIEEKLARESIDVSAPPGFSGHEPGAGVRDLCEAAAPAVAP